MVLDTDVRLLLCRSSKWKSIASGQDVWSWACNQIRCCTWHLDVIPLFHIWLCVLDLQDGTQQGHIRSPASTLEPHICSHPVFLPAQCF